MWPGNDSIPSDASSKNVCNKVDLATPLHAKLTDSSFPPIADRLSAFVFALDTADLYRLQELTPSSLIGTKW